MSKFVYARQSSGDEERSISVEQQISNCIQLAGKVDGVFQDLNTSGRLYWCDILDYVTNNWLNYSIDFIKEAQSNYAKEYAEEKHTSKAKALKHVERDTQAFFAYKLRNELMKSSTKKQLELMKQLQRGGYFKFFE